MSGILSKVMRVSSLFIIACNIMIGSLSADDSMYPKPLQILLEGVSDIGERARIIRIYHKPITAEDKKMVEEARKKAYPNKRKSKKSKKKKRKK